jgi:hypothetical protein
MKIILDFKVSLKDAKKKLIALEEKQKKVA